MDNGDFMVEERDFRGFGVSATIMCSSVLIPLGDPKVSPRSLVSCQYSARWNQMKSLAIPVGGKKYFAGGRGIKPFTFSS